MIAGITAQSISVPRGACGTGASEPGCGMNAERRIASSAITHIAAAIQKMGSASE